MLSLEEDLEKIKELENIIAINDDNFKNILNKYDNNINKLNSKIYEMQYLSKLIVVLVMISYNYNNIFIHFMYTILSAIIIYKLL
jgi:hypothetical protein